MNTARKTACLSVGVGLLVVVMTSTSLSGFAFAQDPTQADGSQSTGGVSKKDLKELSNCQSKAAKDGELTASELDACYTDTFPNSQPASNTTPQPASNTTPQPASNTTPQPASNTTPQPASNTTPQPGLNQIGSVNMSGSNSIDIPKGILDQIIKNRLLSETG